MAKIENLSKSGGYWTGRSTAMFAVLMSIGLAGCTASEPPAAAQTPTATTTAEPTASPTPTATSTASAKPSLSGETITDSFGNPDFYITAAGDTLATVAEVYGFSAAKVAGFNGLQSGAVLAPGTRLRLLPAGPDIGAMGAAVEDANGIPTSYTIVPGDTLAGVTYRFNLTNDQLAEANNVPYVHEVGNVYFIEPGRTIALQKDPVDRRTGAGDAVRNSWDTGVFYTTVDDVAVDGARGTYTADLHHRLR